MKKISLKFLIIIFISFFSFNSFVYADEDFSKVTWWVYDHTNNPDNENLNDDTHKYVKYFKEMHLDSYQIDNHISILDNGKTLDFKGYGTDPITDFVYYPSDNNSKKSFSMNIKKAYADDMWHTFKGLTILFNTKITGDYNSGDQVLNGNGIIFGDTETRIVEFQDIKTRNLHDGDYSDLIELGRFPNSRPLRGSMKIIASFNGGILYDDKSYNKIKIVVDEDTVKLYSYVSSEYYAEELADWNLMEFVLSDGSTSNKVTVNNPTGSYGFGVAIHYKTHSCEKKTNFTITDLSFPAKFDFDNPVVEEPPEPEVEKCTEEYANNNPLACCQKFPEKCNCSNPTYKSQAPELCDTLECVGFSDTEAGKLLQKVFDIIKYSVTVLVLILGTIDFVKAASSQDEQKMKKAQKDFITRLIIAVSLYFVVPLINVIFNLIGYGGTCGIK